MQILTIAIENAIRNMKHDLNKNIAVGEALGMTSAHIGRILSGKVNYFNDETLARIRPILSPYMEEDQHAVAITNNGGVVWNNGHISGDALGAVIRKIMASDRLTDAEKLKVIDILNN